MSTYVYGPDFFVGRRETVLLSASVVVPIVCELLHPASVLDLGCGQGEWLEAFPAEDKLGVDIAAPDGPNYLRRDLTEPLYLGTGPDWDIRTYDLIVCLETAEHLPARAAGTLINTISRHGSTVLFSAAVPGQEGKGHINCQPHEYWHDKFAARGYAPHDVIRPRIAGDHRVSPWYRDNIFLYQR